MGVDDAMPTIYPNLPLYLTKTFSKKWIQSVKKSLQTNVHLHSKNVRKLTAIKVTVPQSCDDEVLQTLPTVIENVNDSAEEWEDVSVCRKWSKYSNIFKEKGTYIFVYN
ncbi:hypothetical protein CHUAL_009839 [Chamberlinius hualienensis]